MYNMDTIKLSTITPQETQHSCVLKMDSGDDTCCASNRVWVKEFIEGIAISCKGISENLPIANVIYAYDCPIKGRLSSSI